MNTHIRDSENALQTVAEGIQEHLDKGNKSINVFTAPARMPIINQFCLLFYQSFLDTIDEYQLKLNDIRVILKILEKMQFGNLVKLSWSDIARSLKMNPTNINRHIKKLKDAALLIEDEGGNTYLNPQIIAKGKFLQNNEDAKIIELLNLGADALDGTNIKPSIMTDKIKNKQYEQHSLLNFIDDEKFREKEIKKPIKKYELTQELAEKLEEFFKDPNKEQEFFDALPKDLQEEYTKKKFEYLCEYSEQQFLPKETLAEIVKYLSSIQKKS